MQLRKSERKKAKIKLGIQGPSGSGKTYSSLLLARGLVESWSEIAVIDTEHGSSDLYADLGDFNVLPLEPKYTPERYIKAINICEQSNVQVIIIDSISHEWEGVGGILDTHANMSGNSFTNWSKITPRHNAFVQKILSSSCHIICTIRSKQDYVLTEKNGKKIPEKVGLKGITREGMDYEFTLLFELDLANHAKASKDRTNLFSKQPPFVITSETGVLINNWCNSGVSIEDVRSKINSCSNLEELTQIYNQYKFYFKELESDFKHKKESILIITNQKINANGITKN